MPNQAEIIVEILKIAAEVSDTSSSQTSDLNAKAVELSELFDQLDGEFHITHTAGGGDCTIKLYNDATGGGRVRF